MVKYRACNKCGWCHFGRTPFEVLDEVWRFLDYWCTIGPDTRAMFGGKPNAVKNYLSCFRCGNDYQDFHDATEDEVPFGSTIQPIMLDI